MTTSGSDVIEAFGVARSRELLRILELPADVRVGVASKLSETASGLEASEFLSKVEADSSGTTRRRLINELRAALAILA